MREGRKIKTNLMHVALVTGSREYHRGDGIVQDCLYSLGGQRVSISIGSEFMVRVFCRLRSYWYKSDL